MEWRVDDGNRIWSEGVHIARFSDVHGPELAAQRAKLAAAAPALLAALRDVEWGARDADGTWICPMCEMPAYASPQAPMMQHAFKCKLAAALRLASEP